MFSLIFHMYLFCLSLLFVMGLILRLFNYCGSWMKMHSPMLCTFNRKLS